MNFRLCNLITLSVCCVFAGCSAGSNPNSAPTSEASGILPSLTHDFGLVITDSFNYHTFIIQNPTDESWRIASIQAECRCTAATSKDSIIAPRGNAEIVVKYHAGKEAATDFRRLIVELEGSQTQRIQLHIKALVRPQLHVASQALNLSGAAGELLVTRTRIYNYSQRDVVGILARSELSTVETELIPINNVDGDGNHERFRQAWELKVTSRSPAAGLVDSGTITILTEDSSLDPVQIPISISTQSVLSVEPAVVFFGTVESNSSASREVSLHVVDNSTIRDSKSVEFSTRDPRISAALKSASGRWLLEVGLDPQGSRGYVASDLQIVLNDAHKTTVLLPVRAKIE